MNLPPVFHDDGVEHPWREAFAWVAVEAWLLFAIFHWLGR